jgi:quercetin dioxygenase-like cupin family protein
MFNSKENMVRISELTDDILKGLTIFANNSVEYKINSGKCVGVGLLKQKDVAVQFVTYSPNSFFPNHSHTNEKEIAIIVSGEFINIMNGEEKKYLSEDVVVIPKGISHSHIIPDGCTLIAITIPASEIYPNDK